MHTAALGLDVSLDVGRVREAESTGKPARQQAPLRTGHGVPPWVQFDEPELVVG